MEEGYRPHVGAAETLLSFAAEAAPPADVGLQQPGQSKVIQEIDDSQLVGVPVQVAVDSVVSAVEPSAAIVEVKPVLKGGEMVVIEKRKRGRPPRAQGKPEPFKRKKEEEEEEDVCFICFDGGSLVLCDRKGCPKAYHPACIKRDEAFFRSKAKWNCGWHICSVCQKASHYMCYTCTYSLCKGCTKDADYLCVRGNKGFCMTCMRTIMLIENDGRGNKDMVQVDFDDKSSWEYLFKVYWIYLKGKLSLTSEELVQAKNPWKGAGMVACNAKSSDACFGDIDVKGSLPVVHRVQPSDLNYFRSEGKVSISNISSRHEELNISSKANPNEQLGLLNGNPIIQEKPASSSYRTLVGCPDWASRELLEFVAHMRNGDKSVLSQFDVQALLLDYIKRNNLRDPRRKSEIVCDLRLKNLFGKPRVGHIEMLKLLEFHFLLKEDSQKDIFARTGFMNAVACHMEGEGFSDNIAMMGKDKKRKTRKRGEERLPLVNLDEYAAIDAHNINLIYLRRELMETLIEDDEKFYDKVVGSIVRIRISGSDQKQDIYRLVQVVGTNKVAVPYKVGDKTADIMLEVLNLDKKETVSIDAISNQEFFEDECRRLRQSIKCGLVKQLTVGEIREKAMALRGLRLNDLLESEILRLNHLRDRANEKGHKKELRECVKKLELLKTPEERQRRLCEVPEVHADPRMGPNCESEDDAEEFDTRKQDEYAKPRFSGFTRSGSKQISPQKGSNIFTDTDCKAYKNALSYEGSRCLSTAFNSSKDPILSGTPGRVKEGRDLCKLNSLGTLGDRVNSVSPAVSIWHGQTVVRSASFLGVASETSRVPFSEEIMSVANNDNETVKLWHYRDPNGKIQGPFCMLQLRKWSTTGLFPSDMRIWVNDEQEGSILLTDALNGQFCKVPWSPRNIALQSQEAEGASDCRSYTCDGGWGRHEKNAAGREDRGGDEIWHGSNVCSDSNNEFVRSHSSDSNTPAVTFKDIQVVSCSPDLSKVNSSDQRQVHSPLPSSTLSGQVDTSLPLEGGSEHGRWSELNHENWSSQKTLPSQVNGVHSHDDLSNSGQSSDQKRRSSAMAPNSMDSDSNFAPMTALSSDKIGDLDASDLPSPTPKASNMDWEGEATKNKEFMSSMSANVPVSGLENLEHHGAENKRSICSDLPVQDVDSSDLPALIPDPKYEDKKGEHDEGKQFVPLNFPVQESVPSWSSASSLVVGGTQVPELADEGGGCSPSPAKPSVEEWESSHVCVSALKLNEAGSDRVNTPTSYNHVNHTSPSDPASNVSNWQTILTETIEFSTLAGESVSDLLAEVDAMESQSGLASPTSAMNRGEELLQDSIEDLCPTPDPGKSDALSSTGDIQLPCQSAVTVETCGASHADLLESLERTGGQSSASPEAVGETKSANSLLDLRKAGLDIQPPVQSTVHRLIHTEIIRSAGLGSMDTGYGGTQLSQAIPNMGLEIEPGMSRGSVNMIRGTAGGGLVGDNPRKYGSERFTGPRDWASQGDSGYNRGRLSWSRQSFGGGGGGYSRSLPKGQRVCKFYESGYCKKGALCNYLHP